jgi:hypothetical protein
MITAYHFMKLRHLDLGRIDVYGRSLGGRGFCTLLRSSPSWLLAPKLQKALRARAAAW